MVDISKFDSVNKSHAINYNDYKALNTSEYSDENSSIFANNETNANLDVEYLNQQLDEIQAKQGVFSNGWNNFKEFVGVGATAEKCDEAIRKYKNGEISFEEASEIISDFGNRQDSSLNLFSNIATGVAAIVAGSMVVATGGALAPVAAGMITGAVTKSTFKFTDRATNEEKGDALDAKQLAKDALSGAISGGIGVATAGTAGTPFTKGFELGGKKLVEAGTKACVAKCAHTGVITGSISGASNNIIECAFEEDKDFNVKDFARETATSALVGGTVGALMGGLNGTLRSNNLLSNGGDVVSSHELSDIVANSVCSAEYKIANQGIRNITSAFAA